MNKIDKEFALQCRLITSGMQGLFLESLQEFADLVRADEREACAKVCEHEWSNAAEREFGEECAAAIRARGNT